MVDTQTLRVQKTARYFTIGELNNQTEEVWLVLHGYAQLAANFILPFEVLDNGKRLIVAPEGLNKFYAKGFGGQPAANWMTSEDRENEIADYVFYLDALTDRLKIPTNVKLVLFGFSQGVATASRWLHHTQYTISRFIIYAGEIALELKNPIAKKLVTTPLTYVTGNKDKLISNEKLTEVKQLMSQLKATEIVFEGGHEVKEDVLLQLQ